MKKVGHQNQGGLTFVELLVALAIVSILTLATTIGYHFFYKKNQLQVTLDKLYILLNSAKIKASERRLPVVICSSIDNISCLESDWQNKLLVFVDHNNNKRFDGDDERLNHDITLPNQLKLKWQGFPKGNLLSFQPISLLSSSNGTLTLYNTNEKNHMYGALIISKSAVVRYANEV